MTHTTFALASDILDNLQADIAQGNAPLLFRMGVGQLEQIEVGPGLILLIGGAPGAGKTALTMQLVVDALRLNESLRVCICNVEMTPQVLLERQLARVSDINLTKIRKREIDATQTDLLQLGMDTLKSIADRLCFVRPPYNLSTVANAVDDFDAQLIVLDYIQRIRPPGVHGDKRGSVDACMSYLREFCDAGKGVIVVAAVARQKDNRGRSTYAGDSLSLASFRESSELEFSCDDAYILAPRDGDEVTLKHLKARHSEPRDIQLIFDRSVQRFEATGNDRPAPLLQAALAASWDSAVAAQDEEDDSDE